MKNTLTLFAFLTGLAGATARADAPEWSQFLTDQLRRVSDSVPDTDSLGTAELAHVFLTVRAEVDIGIRDLGEVQLQPELIFVFASPNAKP